MAFCDLPGAATASRAPDERRTQSRRCEALRSESIARQAVARQAVARESLAQQRSTTSIQEPSTAVTGPLVLQAPSTVAVNHSYSRR